MVNWPGETVLTRLIDTFEKGVGGALRPWQIKRVEGASAEARIKERLMLEQAEHDIAEIRAGRKMLSTHGKIVDSDKPETLLLESDKGQDTQVSQVEVAADSFSQSAKDADDARILQRSVNLKRVALLAEEEAERLDETNENSAEQEDDKPQIDPDWFSKWRNGAQDIHQDQLQRLWAKLLVGEISQSGSYSLHTIDFLSRMSSHDANLLARVAPFFVRDAGIVKFDRDKDFFSTKGLTISDFLYLDDIGLLNGVAGLGLSWNAGVTKVGDNLVGYVICNQTVLTFYLDEEATENTEISLSMMPVTRVGREILSLANFPADDDYMKKIADKIIQIGAKQVEKGRLHADGMHIMDNHVIATKTI